MGLGIARIEREGDLVLGNCFQIFAGLEEAKSQSVVSLNKIRIDLHGFLKMLGGNANVPGLEGLSGALELFQRFRRDAKLAYWDGICR